MKWTSLLVSSILLTFASSGCGPHAQDEASEPSVEEPEAQAQVSFFDPVQARALTVQAMQACRDEDFPSCRDLLEQATKHRPGQVEIWMLLAGVEHRLGHEDATAEALARIEAIGLAPPFDRAPFYDTLIDQPRQAEAAAVLAEKGKPSAVAEAFLQLEDRDLIPEGVAFDSATGAFYISSVHRRSIVQVLDGVESRLVADGGLWSVLGLAVDGQRRLLWATTAALPQMRDFDTELEGRSALVGIDLEGAEKPRRLELGRDRAHVLNDLTIAADGTVLVADNRVPGNVYRLANDSDQLEALIPEGFFRSPQGVALSADEKRLFVADYSLGLTLLELGDGFVAGHADYLEPPDDVCLTGIDGLVAGPADGQRDVLIAVQNLYRPHRVLRLEVDADQLRILAVEVLEQARLDYSEPTLGAIVDGAFVYIANSQWNRFNEDAELPPLEQLERPLLLRLNL